MAALPQGMLETVMATSLEQLKGKIIDMIITVNQSNSALYLCIGIVLLEGYIEKHDVSLTHVQKHPILFTYILLTFFLKFISLFFQNIKTSDNQSIHLDFVRRTVIFLLTLVINTYWLNPSNSMSIVTWLQNSTSANTIFIAYRDTDTSQKTINNYVHLAVSLTLFLFFIIEFVYLVYKWSVIFYRQYKCPGWKRAGRCPRFLQVWFHCLLHGYTGSSVKEQHRNKLREDLKFWTIEIVTSNPHDDQIVQRVKRERKNCFGKLKIVKTSVVNKCLAEETPQHFLKRISEVKENISPTDLLSNESKQCFLRGIAGIGKSSFVEYLTFMWADSQWYRDMFDYIFLIECRLFEEDIDDKYPETYLETFIKENCNVESLHRIGEKVLIIIDGLDELHELKDVIESKRGRLHCLLSKDSKFLPGHFTILTGRPHVEHFFISNKSMNTFRLYEITGLDPDQIKNFIEVFAANNQEIAEKIIKKINASPNIEALATVPQYLQIMCFITKESDEVIQKENLTPLYTWMFICLWIKHIGKDRHKLLNYREIFEDEDVAWFLKQLSDIAYNLFMDNKITFRKESFSELFKSERLQRDKIQAMFNAFITERKKTRTYQFRHLTLHEFFAAADCYRKNIPIDELLSKGLFQMVRFIGGFYGADAADENDQERLVVKSFTKCIKPSDLSPNVIQENAERTCHSWFLDLFKKLEGLKFNGREYNIEVLKEAYEFANSLPRSIYVNSSSFDLNSSISESEINSLAEFLSTLENKRLRSILHLCNMHVFDHLKILKKTEQTISTIFTYIPDMKMVWFEEYAFYSQCLDQLLRNFRRNDPIYIDEIFFINCSFEDANCDALAEIIIRTTKVVLVDSSFPGEEGDSIEQNINLLNKILTLLNGGDTYRLCSLTLNDENLLQKYDLKNYYNTFTRHKIKFQQALAFQGLSQLRLSERWAITVTQKPQNQLQ